MREDALEHELREKVQSQVSRGRVDVTIRLSETSLEKFREITGQVTKAKAGQ